MLATTNPNHNQRERDAPGVPKNGERAELALNTVYYFGRQGKTIDEPLRDQIVDLVADLGHLCDRAGIDFEEAVDSAREHWQEER